MLVRCREPESSNGFGNQGGIAEFNPSLMEGRIFLFPSCSNSLKANEIITCYIQKERCSNGKGIL